jgi:hypothetical protein
VLFSRERIRGRFLGVPLSRTKVPPACLLAIAWIALVFEPNAAGAKINTVGSPAPYSLVAHATRYFFEETRSNAGQGASTAAMSVGTWRLVRTPGRGGGPGEVSIAQTADASRSDIELVGLMLRCSDTGFDVLVIFLKPIPPRAHPKVKLTTGSAIVELDATVVSPGIAILLPAETAALVNGSWQSFSELAIEVDDGSAVVRGVISLAGLGPALSLLTSSCPSR